MTATQLLEVITTKEITEWKAFSILEPFGPLEEARRFHDLKAFIGNMMRKEGSERLKAEHFMVDQDELEEALFEDDKQKLANAKKALKDFAKAFNERAAKKTKVKETKKTPRRKKQ